MDVPVASQASEAGWRCPTCGRSFRRARQQHSCKRVPLEDHLRNESTRELFDHLLAQVRQHVGPCEVLPLPCCIHLVASHDFLAVLPRKGGLELHFSLGRELDDERIARSARISSAAYKHDILVHRPDEVDAQLLGWVAEAYALGG